MPDKKVNNLETTWERFVLFTKERWRFSLISMVMLALLGGIFLSIFWGYRQIQLLGTELNKGVEILEESHTTIDQLQTDFENSVEENIAIEQEMTKCVFKHNADAMMVFKFHNSRTDLQGKHDFFYSATNEVSQKDVNSFLPEVQAIPIVRLGKFITPMIEGNCQVVHTDSIETNDWLKGKLQLQDIETIVACPIYSRGNLLGFTELIYTSGNSAPIGEENFSETLQCFKETTDHIGLIIQK